MIEKIKAISKFLSWALVLFFAYLLFSPVASFAAIDTIAVDVGISVFKTMPIGIVPFTETRVPLSGSRKNLIRSLPEMQNSLDVSK